MLATIEQKKSSHAVMVLYRMPHLKSSRNALSKIPENDEELWKALAESFKMARRGKLKTADEFRFEVFFMENLEILFEEILRNYYKPSRSKAFIVYNPVIREIFAAPFRDRIVHHLIYGACGLWWDRHFICNSFSCRDNKGTLVGAKALQHSMRAVVEEDRRKGLSGENARVLKGDFSGYFMSLRREVLFKRVCWGLDLQFEYNKGYAYRLLKYLWKEIVFDDPVEGALKVGKPSDWDKLPRNKSLFFQPEGQGIVIGNLTSQLLSNIMLDILDQYVTKELGFKHYGRYVDDFYIVAGETDYKRAKNAIDKFIPELVEPYGLKLHPRKRYDQKIYRGVPFLGKKVLLTHMTLGPRTIRNYFVAAREVMEGKRDVSSITSFYGLTAHTFSKRLNERVFDSVGWRYQY